MRLAIVVTGQDQGRAITIMRHRLPRFGKKGRRSQQVRHLVEDRALFGLVPVRIDIDAGRQRLDSGAEGGLAAGERIGEGALHGGGAAGRSGHVHRVEGCATLRIVASWNLIEINIFRPRFSLPCASEFARLPGHTGGGRVE